MSAFIVVLLIAAVGLVAAGVQVSARQLQRFPVDNKSPGPLIDSTTNTTYTVRPAELELLYSMVVESLSSAAVADTKLWPLLDDLDRRAPGDGGTEGRRDLSARRSRAQKLDDLLQELEVRRGSSPPVGR